MDQGLVLLLLLIDVKYQPNEKLKKHAGSKTGGEDFCVKLTAL